MKLLIKGGRVVDPSRDLDLAADVFIENGAIREVAPRLERHGLAGETVVLDAAGLIVAPGLVDMHVHLREPGKEWAETIESGTRAAATGGFTAVACMPNTEPALDTPAAVRFVLERARERGAVRVHPIAAVTRGRRGESLTDAAELVAAGAVALTDDGAPVSSSRLMRRALEYTRMLNVPIVSHAEDKELSGRGVMHEGTISTLLGLPGIPSASEEVSVARDIALAELAGGRLHLAHLSTAGAVDLLRRGREKGIRVTAEVTPHHLALTDEAVRGYDTNTKMNPPLRTAVDREALCGALADGTIEVVATDHAPHHPDAKDVEFGLAPFGVVGLETAVGVVFTRLVHTGRLPLDRAVRALSTAPARILGLDAGTLAPGRPADVSLIDPEEKWTVDAAVFASLSRNTCFQGAELRGRAVATIVGGRVVMYRGELFPDPGRLLSGSTAGR